MSRASNLAGFTTAVGPPTDLNVGIVTAISIISRDNLVTGDFDTSSASGKGAKLSQFGTLFAQRPEANGLVFATLNGAFSSNDSYSIRMYADGDADFVGDVEIGPVTGIGITLNASGSAQFASGSVKIGDLDNSSANSTSGVQLFAGGTVNTKSDSINSEVFRIFNSESSNSNILFTANGSSRFTTKVEVGPAAGIGATIFSDGAIVTGAGATFTGDLNVGNVPTTGGIFGEAIGKFKLYRQTTVGDNAMFNINSDVGGSDTNNLSILADGSLTIGGALPLNPNTILDHYGNANFAGIGSFGGTSNLSTNGAIGLVGFTNTETKTYPTTSSFNVTAGNNINLELGTSQTIDPTTPGGYNFVSADGGTYTKSAGSTSDIERLYFNGYYQSFTWTDANTCKQYRGFNDNFTYSGINANSRTSSYLSAKQITLSPPDGGTQTITNVVSPSLMLYGTGTSTVNITNTFGYQPQLRFLSGDSGTKTVNITNAVVYDVSEYWGTTVNTGTLSATITNLYGLRLRPPAATTGLTITNNWGIYQEWSQQQNWFAASSNRFPNLSTTASGANAFLDSTDSNRLYRSTSSIVYKKNIEDLETTYADRILGLRPVWYRSKCENDRSDWSWYGFIAEEVAAIDPRLVHYGYQEDAYETVSVTETVDIPTDDPRFKEGVETEEVTKEEVRLKADAEPVPDGIAYDRFVVPLLNIIQRQQAAIETLEQRLTDAGL